MSCGTAFPTIAGECNKKSDQPMHLQSDLSLCYYGAMCLVNQGCKAFDDEDSDQPA